MHWFWLGFFALVALLLFLDLGVVHRRAREMPLRAAVGWTAGWVALGLSFTGVVYVMYEYKSSAACTCTASCAANSAAMRR